MGKGQELYKKAKTMIPGGTMLLSKRPEQHLPEHWPAYFSKSKGCKVWDLDGREYIDCSMMGIGTNTLGYCNEAVDAAVMEVVKNGNMTTLNCPEEVELAERLIELNKPWAGGVRFSRAGGEANAISIRIARAFTGKDKVAVCGYHGWHDWYLSVNLGEDDALAGYLLTGLDPAGVPRGLHNSTLPFHYNKFEELLEIVNHNDLAAIKMEVSRNMEPNDDFLNKVRKLATERGIVLIFDECTSGFRETFGGLYRKYGVNPDMAVFSKTIGNGFAISAVVGPKRLWMLHKRLGFLLHSGQNVLVQLQHVQLLKKWSELNLGRLLLKLVNQTRRDGKHLRINMVLRFSTKASLLLLFISLIVQII